MKIIVDFPQFLIDLMIKRQSEAMKKSYDNMSQDEKKATAFMAGYNAGIAALTENIIEDMECESFIDELAE